MTRPTFGYIVAAGGSGGSDITKADRFTTQAKSANFTAAPWFFYLITSTSGTVAATLPAASVAGEQVAFKWDAGTNTVTLNRAGSDTIGAAATTANFSLASEVWVFESSGSGQWNLISGNKTLASLDGRYAPTVLTAGQVIPGRDLIHDSVTLISGQVWFAGFTADKTELVSNITVGTRSTAAGATPTLCRMGVYSVDASDNLTLVASTVNDTTLFAATNTTYTRALSVPFTKQVGTRYATAILVVSGAAMPTLVGLQLAPTSFVNSFLKAAPARYTLVTGQTDLPATVTAASLGGQQTAAGFYLT